MTNALPLSLKRNDDERARIRELSDDELSLIAGGGTCGTTRVIFNAETGEQRCEHSDGDSD